MKKFTTILAALVLLVISTTAFAGAVDPVSKAYELSLYKNFSQAEDVSWKKNGDLYFAYFEQGGTKMFAAFNEDAELFAFSRDLHASQIPLSISRNVKHSYPGYAITTPVSEIVMQGSTAYYFTVENKEEALQLKSDANGNITHRSRTIK